MTQEVVSVPRATLEFYISTALTYAIENWDLFHSEDIISEFRLEIIGDIVSDLKEDGYIRD